MNEITKANQSSPNRCTSAARRAGSSGRFYCLADDPEATHEDAIRVCDLAELRRCLAQQLAVYPSSAIEPLSETSKLG